MAIFFFSRNDSIICVGCMSVSLGYFEADFPTIWTKVNFWIAVDFGSSFIESLYCTNNEWSKGHYYSLPKILCSQALGNSWIDRLQFLEDYLFISVWKNSCLTGLFSVFQTFYYLFYPWFCFLKQVLRSPRSNLNSRSFCFHPPTKS